MATLGDRLRRARDRKNLTQKSVFNKTGITDKSLSRYENNKAEPDTESLLALSNLYDVSLDWLLGKEIKKESVEALPEGEYERVINELEKEYGVSLRDDPIVLSSVRQMIEIIAQTKRDKQ